MNKKKGSPRSAIETLQIPWIDLGDITASQAAPAVTARAYAAVVALGSTKVKLWDLPVGYNCIEIRFSTTAAADADVVDVLVASGEDHFVRVATLTLTGGAQTAPVGARAVAGTFVDTIVVTNKRWHGAIEVVQAAGGDYVARFTMDMLGYDKVVFHATTLESSSTLTIEGRGF